MSAAASVILADLQIVSAARAERATDRVLGARVAGLQAFQQRRFAVTYADLLSSARYGRAARFFLEQLYGPADFSDRDAQFARVVPALVRLFPAEVVRAVVVLSDLHALTEVLDTAMARHASSADWTPHRYALAWQQTGRRADRETQIASTVLLATQLDALTRNQVIRRSLWLMRLPARATGLGGLQRFLEAGFDAFSAMDGAQELIRLIDSRERAFAEALFALDPADAALLAWFGRSGEAKRIESAQDGRIAAV